MFISSSRYGPNSVSELISSTSAELRWTLTLYGSLKTSKLCIRRHPRHPLVLENYLELGGEILQVSRLGVETLKNEVFLTKKAAKSWLKRLVANLSKHTFFENAYMT